MKSSEAWRNTLAQLSKDPGIQVVMGRGGKPTLRVGEVFLHSQYNPEQEAQRLVDSAELDPRRPVLVIGLGLGYHVQELLRRGHEVAVAEPNPAVARAALESTLRDTAFPLIVEDVPSSLATAEFKSFAAQIPQILVHPPTARVAEEAVRTITGQLACAILGAQHLSIAVVGPMYGGSLPMTEYIASGFRKLGHRVTVVDNSAAWGLYEAMTGSIRARAASAQMGQMLANIIAEWSYARVVEVDPEFCLVMAQAPVGPQFPERLRRRGISTAFWYVENWRHLPYWQQIAPLYDSFFHIQPGEFERKLEEAGCRNHAFIQTGCDPDRHRAVTLTAHEMKDYGCDLSFAGAGYYNRLQFFKGLTDYDFKIWGVGWKERELSRLVAGGERRFDNEEFMKMVAGSKINLNLHSSNASPGVDPECDAINPRVFEIAAAGGFQICDACKGLAQHFDLETELPVYRNLAEARSLIDRYLSDDAGRQEVARRARVRALNHHTYAHRAQAMLDHVFTRHGAFMLKRGVRVQRTVGEMAERISDIPLKAWLRKLPKDVLFLQEALMPFIVKSGPGLSVPEKLFVYMNEVREFAQALLKEKR
ncbi:MAG: glycosyltransferase [Candidatus Hydrogenedentes bacterium]|nr:glycosyltransferase [Candidatus Hydrogenedentota bacterium]